MGAKIIKAILTTVDTISLVVTMLSFAGLGLLLVGAVGYVCLKGLEFILSSRETFLTTLAVAATWVWCLARGREIFARRRPPGK